jgi:hypothetical protein
MQKDIEKKTHEYNSAWNVQRGNEIKYSNVNSLQIKQTRRHVREFVLSSGEQQREEEYS